MDFSRLEADIVSAKGKSVRRFVAAMFVMAVGMVLTGGVAAANPTYANATIAVTYNGGSEFIVEHGNFGSPDGADDSIELVVSYGGPSGLRSTPALAAAAAKAETYTFVPDEDGNYTAVVQVSKGDLVSFTATGTPSGDLASTSVVFTSDGSYVSGGKTGGAAYQQSSGGGSTGGYDAGLANTGTSIAGPLAIGVVALIAGLALLFFGTRGIARRKGVSNSQ